MSYLLPGAPSRERRRFRLQMLAAAAGELALLGTAAALWWLARRRS